MIDPLRADDAIRAVNRRRYAALILHWAVRPLGYVEFSDVYCMDPRTLPPQRELNGYVIEHATDADIDYICRFLPRDEPPHVIRMLWSEGHHCFVARYDGKVIAYDWIAFSSVQEEEYRIEIKPGDAFCLNAYTIPQHRGKGVHARRGRKNHEKSECCGVAGGSGLRAVTIQSLRAQGKAARFRHGRVANRSLAVVPGNRRYAASGCPHKMLIDKPQNPAGYSAAVPAAQEGSRC